ncbi:MAG: glycosyltransferase [Ferrimicrobium sp.]
MIDRIRQFLASSAFARGGLSFLIATMVVNLSNFVFHMVISRLLGPSDYGELGSLLNLMVIFTVPLGALQAAITHAEASRRQANRPGVNVSRLLGRTALLGAFGTIMIIVFGPVLASFLHLGSFWLVVMLALWLLPSVLGAVLQGVLIGRLRFGPVAVASLLGSVLGRLAFGVVFVELGGGVLAALSASVFAQVIVTCIVGGVLVREIFARRRGIGSGIELRGSVLAILALGGFWVLSSEDTVLARHFLSGHDAGIYAASATAGRIALFLPGAIATIAFPQFSVGRGMSEVARRALRWSLLATAGVGLGATIVLAALPSLAIELLFGSSYLAGAGILRLLALEAGMLGIASLLTFFHLARGALASLIPWVGVVLAVVGIDLFHGSGIAIAGVMVAATVVVLAVMLIGAANALLRDPLTPAVEIVAQPSTCAERVEGIDLSIVVPYYNPGSVLARHLRSIEDVLCASGLAFEVIAVSDGSTDESTSEAIACGSGDLRFLQLGENCGKGYALRVGLAEAKGRYLGFIDADGDIPAEQLLQFIKVISSTEPDIVSGSKRHPDSDVYYPVLRRIYSWGYQQLIWVLFHLKVRDTQTGIKVIRRQVLEAILPLTVEKRFAFDLELFVVARRLGFHNIVEVPVTIKQRFTSTISLRAVKGMLLDTFGIFYRLRLLHYYDRSVVQVEVTPAMKSPVAGGES